MGDGTKPEPPISSGNGGDPSHNTQEDDESRPTDLDDHIPDTEPEETEEVDKPSAPTRGTPSGGGASGAPIGVPPGPSPIPEDPSDEGSNDCDDPEAPVEPGTPEYSEPEQEPEQSDEDFDKDDDSKQEDEDDVEDDEEEDQEVQAQIVTHSDPWDSIGWGLYPVRLQLKEEYGDQVQFDDQLMPVREFSSPEDMEQDWEKWAPRHGMPVNTDIWSDDPPESTELSNQAVATAREQSIPLAKRFIRRLRTAAVVEGINIEDRKTLFDLARDVGLDTEQLEKDWDDVHVPMSVNEVETPKTTIHVDNQTVTQPGLLTANDLKTPLKRAGLQADDPQSLLGFVDEHGPVATEEVRQVYDYSKEKALEKLNEMTDIEPVEYGGTTFWATT